MRTLLLAASFSLTAFSILAGCSIDTDAVFSSGGSTGDGSTTSGTNSAGSGGVMTTVAGGNGGMAGSGASGAAGGGGNGGNGAAGGNGGSGGSGGSPPDCNPACTGDDICVNQMCVHICEVACDTLASCVNGNCGEPVIDQGACFNNCSQDPVGFNAEAIINASCNDLYDAVCENNVEIALSCQCGPGEAGTTNAGAPCVNDGQCNASNGFLTPTCFQHGDGWPNGYCVAADCINSAACGPGNWCVQVDQNSTACFDGCMISNDCRPGYNCQPVGQQAAVCLPAG